MEILLKNFIIKELNSYNIPSGYHTFNCYKNNEIITIKLRADSDKYNYCKHITIDDIKNKIKEYLLIDDLNIDIKDNTLNIYIEIKYYDEYKLKIKTEYPCVYLKITDGINYNKLYQQLNMHKINQIDQHLYDLIITNDENYYNNLYLEHWNNNMDNIDLSNDIIIQSFIQFLNYENIVNILKDDKLIDFVIQKFDFNDGIGNYNLLTKLIENKNINNINVLIKIFKAFDDNGILITIVKNAIIMEKKWQDIFNLLLDWELIQKQKYTDELVECVIQYNWIYALTILLKNGLYVKQDYLFIAKELNKDKIHCLLCKYLD